jgi:hypothetical protein
MPRLFVVLLAFAMIGSVGEAGAEQLSSASGSASVKVSSRMSVVGPRHFRARLQLVRIASDIPIIPLPAVLRPKRPPADTPL